jgi:DNA-binding HxlR family transcriptional regulator
MELQQVSWGEQKLYYGLRISNGDGGRVKNVCWWRDHKELAESNFTRALRSLERRGILERRQQPGCHPSWTLTILGIQEAKRLKQKSDAALADVC